MRYKINITDKNDKPVYVGDCFYAQMIMPSFEEPTLVRVVKDVSQENLDCDRDFDVEDNEGNRLWNAYMVIKNSELINQPEL